MELGGDSMPIKIINDYADAITSACGLDNYQAKTVVYWAIATHAINKLERMPILTICGGYGTGKSTLFKVIQQICFSPIILDGKVTKPVLRDGLKPNTTAFIEEADRIDEDIILKRHSRQTSKTIVKRPSGSTNSPHSFVSEPMDTFGSTLLHRRQPFRDPAVDSRSITIRTIHRPGPFIMPTLSNMPIATLATNIDWTLELPITDGRAFDTWRPLLQAAWFVQDSDWIPYALKELEKAKLSLEQGQGYEINQLVVSKVIALGAVEQQGNQYSLRDRVSLHSISKGLKDDGHYYNSWQIGKVLNELGFQKRLSGGTEYVYLDKGYLVALANGLGIDDDVLNKL